MKFPPSCTAYADAARSAQQAHFWLLRIQLSLAAIAAAVAATMAVPESPLPMLEGFSVIVAFFAIGIVVQLVATRQQFERRWYVFRAVRESQKSLIWQFAVGLGEFTTSTPGGLSSYIKRMKEAEDEFALKPPTANPRPDEEERFVLTIQQMRAEGWETRRSVFLRERVDDQISWYGSRVKENKRSANALDAMVVILQISGIVLSVVLLERHFNGSSLLALTVCVLASLVAWGQAKQYSSLIGPYSNAQRELMSIRQLINVASSESEFVRSGSEAEEAISREHSLWCARRGVQRAHY